MTYQYDGYNWLVRLDKGELLASTITQLVKDTQMPGAWISGIGAVQWVELGFYNLTSQVYQWKRFDQLMEITALQGNVAWEGGEPALHLHGTFSDQDFQAHGGHVKDFEVGGTCEILIHRWYADPLQRAMDPATGLNVLQLKAGA
jgi:predicted DNA-binding protein with PD1-like motif